MNPWDAVRLAGHALIALADAARGNRTTSFAPVVYIPASTYSVTELVNEFLIAKARAQRSDRYLRQARSSLKSFVPGPVNNFHQCDNA